jgi:hypothetical protein
VGYGFLETQGGYLDPDYDVLWKELSLDRRIECIVFLFADGVEMEDSQRVKIRLKELMMGIDISSLSSST